jgi:hypothetical protein
MVVRKKEERIYPLVAVARVSIGMAKEMTSVINPPKPCTCSGVQRTCSGVRVYSLC